MSTGDDEVLGRCVKGRSMWRGVPINIPVANVSFTENVPCKDGQALRVHMKSGGYEDLTDVMHDPPLEQLLKVDLRGEESE